MTRPWYSFTSQPALHLSCEGSLCCCFERRAENGECIEHDRLGHTRCRVQLCLSFKDAGSYQQPR